ncbi:hypothetical protein Tsubulata_019389 [Turnera subulata]|uniref:RRM domain-containing protein n=1 Tax=Turnera subulata TaxID=218843 RepID=A0A9Q0JDF4_9ROSI|nr:hypothetical protein Tsubulata_019389 [Turnera subulata]
MMLSNPAAAASVCCCCCAANSFLSSPLIIPNNNNIILKKNPLSSKPLFSRKHNASLSFSFPLQKCTLGGFFALGALTNGRKQRGGGTTSVGGKGDSDDEEEEEDEEEDDSMFDEEEEEEEYGEDGDGNDDDDLVLPLDKMKKWLKKKPRGFGEGKVYDTSVEDKLLEQIVQSRQAQSSNLNNLKKNPVLLPSKKDPKINKKAAAAAASSSEVVAASGIPVRVSNLPKKKNIHRDLKSAFKDVRGLVDIIPAVSGNQKTKDPICKGFAFVYFRTEDAAARFVQLFSRQPVAFGRIQKQIRCEMINQSSSNTPNGESKSSLFFKPQIVASALQGHSGADLDTDDAFVKETESGFSDSSDNELIATDLEDVSVGSSELKDHDGEKPKIEPGTGPSLKRLDKSRAPKKKSIAKGGRKVPKLAVPGSAKRLKIKDKSVLTDVLSKYGLKTALTGEQR